MNLSIEEIEKNWSIFEKLCSRLSDDNISNLLNELGERISTCPSSAKLDQYQAYPGGLVQHSLDVASTMRKLNDAHDLGLKLSLFSKFHFFMILER